MGISDIFTTLVEFLLVGILNILQTVVNLIRLDFGIVICYDRAPSDSCLQMYSVDCNKPKSSFTRV